MAKQLIDVSADCCKVMKKLKNMLTCGTAIIDAFMKYELVYQSSTHCVSKHFLLILLVIVTGRASCQ